MGRCSISYMYAGTLGFTYMELHAVKYIFVLKQARDLYIETLPSLSLVLHRNGYLSIVVKLQQIDYIVWDHGGKTSALRISINISGWIW